MYLRQLHLSHVFDPILDINAFIEMTGKSGETGVFDCDKIFGIIGAGTTRFDADPVIAGGVSIAQIACNAIFSGWSIAKYSAEDRRKEGDGTLLFFQM